MAKLNIESYSRGLNGKRQETLATGHMIAMGLWKALLKEVSLGFLVSSVRRSLA